MPRDATRSRSKALGPLRVSSAATICVASVELTVAVVSISRSWIAWAWTRETECGQRRANQIMPEAITRRPRPYQVNAML